MKGRVAHQSGPKPGWSQVSGVGGGLPVTAAFWNEVLPGAALPTLASRSPLTPTTPCFPSPSAPEGLPPESLKLHSVKR